MLFRSRLRDLLLTQWRERGATIVFVTHDLREALQLGDRVLFMSASPGRVVLDIDIPLPRPRDQESDEMEAFRHTLLKEHPAILAGLEESNLQEERRLVPAGGGS